jgi:type I restriction enzyme M protein
MHILQNKKNCQADYISGRDELAPPEEIEAVQVFSRQLVEDYGYPKEDIQTRP